jgi:hypothetical protein
VLEARDKAGNKRNFVGQGFQLPAYRLPGPLLTFAGDASLVPSARSTDTMRRTASPLVLEAASWLNQVDARQPVRIVVRRSFERGTPQTASRLARPLALPGARPDRGQRHAATRRGDNGGGAAVARPASEAGRTCGARRALRE